jgi:solute carrier family 10 (sodium/bile acid cotransporter), member 7
LTCIAFADRFVHRACVPILSRIIPDRFIWVLIATIALASVLPVRGADVATANLVSSGAVFLIFLLHGIRLPRAEVIAGVRNWRVQGALFLFVFGAMGLTGLALARVTDGWLPPLVALGFLYCGVLPTTVQSATTYTSLAKGAVAVSVVASALINLAAILVTPGLFALLAGRDGGVALSGDLAVRIALILLLPFLIGQSVQRWVRPLALRFPAAIKTMDQSAIAIAVYVAFSAAVVDGIWTKLSNGDFAVLGAAITAMLLVGFGGSWLIGGAMRLPRGQRTAMLFSGAHKSIAVGAPLAALLFPASAAGMVLLPVLVYHLAQLVLSAWIAPLLARKALDGHAPSQTLP